MRKSSSMASICADDVQCYAYVRVIWLASMTGTTDKVPERNPVVIRLSSAQSIAFSNSSL